MVQPVRVSKVMELESVLGGFAGKTLDVICRGAPDPDFIGATMAFGAICAKTGVGLRLRSTSPVGHPQNREELRLLGLEIPVFRQPENLAGSAGYVVLDACDIRPRIRSALDGAPWVALIDHHDPHFLNGARPIFTDVRPDSAGSTCTILASYLLETGLLRSSPQRAVIATALDFGVRIDTKQFRHCYADDHRVMAEILSYHDGKMIESLMYHSTPKFFMDKAYEAWQNMAAYGNFVLAPVSSIDSDHRDAIGFAADRIINVKGYDTSIVYAVISDPLNGPTVQGSLRTCDRGIRPGKFLEDLIPGISEVGGDCGGRAHMGGFEIPFGSIKGLVGRRLSSKAGAWQLFQDYLSGRLREVIKAYSWDG